jgi:hypothetical protein
MKSTLIDFSTYAANAWGSADNGDLTGGTSLFQGSDATALTLAIQGVGSDSALHITGTIPPSSYAGFVLWFGPCANISAIPDGGTSTGLTLPIGGSLGGATLKFEVQSAEDYPVDTTNMKGSCLYTSCGTKYSDCVSPTTTLKTLPTAPTATTYPWTGFVGGLPTATTTGDGVVGLQFQYECQQASTCMVDMTIGTIVLAM